MKQTIFNTRQRAEEIIKEAIAVWEQSTNSEHLEGIEQDSVFSLFLTALAYQANEIDNEIEQLKAEILYELGQMLVPYERTHALPATATVEVTPSDSIAIQTLDHRTVFSLQDTPFTFIPFLRTRVFNCKTTSIARMDSRRWKVALQCKEPLNNLSGMTFLIGNPHFQDLKVFANGHPLPLIKPWDYADLPLDSCFSLENLIYNQSPVFQPRHIWFDLFARQNVRLFAIDSYRTPAASQPTERLELVFEFFGIDDQFLFDKEMLSLNCTILANASIASATLSASSPITRLAGRNDLSTRWQFLHLLRPADTQIFKEEPIEIRKMTASRFNPEHLVKLASTLISRFSSDYYAFQGIDTLREGNFMDSFYSLLKKMSEGVAKASNTYTSSLYLMLKNDNGFRPKDKSLHIDYLVTNGSSVNGLLNNKSKFNIQANGYFTNARLVAEPMPGFDEAQSIDAENALARYYLTTNDRIVTPADIKVLCYNELAARFGITNEMITGIRVRNSRHTERNHCGLETQVYISLKNDPFIKRSFQGKIPMTEMVLQKMIEVRSANILPVQVNIEIG